MKKLLAGIALAVLLAGCGDQEVLMTQRKTIVVVPDDATYRQCPQFVDLPPVIDTQSGASGVLIMYGVYQQCRQTVSDIKTEIERLKVIAERDNPKE